MRGWCLAAVLAAAGVLAACAIEAPPVVFVGYGTTEWRTSQDQPLTTAEFDALREACGPRPVAAYFDAERRVPNPQRDIPAYHPGGTGLGAAPPIGLAALDLSPAPSIARRLTTVLEPLDECLQGKGLLPRPLVPVLPQAAPPVPPTPEIAPPSEPPRRRHVRKRHHRAKRHRPALVPAALPDPAPAPLSQPASPEAGTAKE